MVLMHTRQGLDEEGIYMKKYIVKMFFRDPEKDWAIPPSVKEDRIKMYGPNRPDNIRRESWNFYYKAGSEENVSINKCLE